MKMDLNDCWLSNPCTDLVWKSKYIFIFKTKTKPEETETFLEAFD